ncbi:MAG: universal stress protein [Chloroflexi bacterium]|nr:universal stress protein [Chloroflexota bacterium]MCI0889624.1 universal stress protein [Chloroflexota bacterium]
MKILVPLDRSTRDGVVLPYSASAARAYDGRLVVLNVMPTTRSIVPGAMREMKAYLEAIVSELNEQGIEHVEYAVRRGDVASVIVNFVDECKCDMIVMASRGRGGLGKLVMGSVADAVLSSCGKPVLLLSESSNSAKVDDTVRQQSAYLATVLWNKQARGLINDAEARDAIEMMTTAGLDEHVLTSTYETLEEQGGLPFGWLDIDFQLDTLRSFLPSDVDRQTRDLASFDVSDRRAA